MANKSVLNDKINLKIVHDILRPVAMQGLRDMCCFLLSNNEIVDPNAF